MFVDSAFGFGHDFKNNLWLPRPWCGPLDKKWKNGQDNSYKTSEKAGQDICRYCISENCVHCGEHVFHTKLKKAKKMVCIWWKF